MLGVGDKSKEMVSCVYYELIVFQFFLALYALFCLISIITFCFHGISSENRKKRGCGTLKGLKVISKRFKAGNQKLKVEFSRLGGAGGKNSRTFSDEIVMFTRKMVPLIGVRTWKDIHQDVKESITSNILVIIIFSCVYILIIN